MTIKVVYNNCFGGFGISKACAEWMAERGHEGAIKLIKDNQVIERECSLTDTYHYVWTSSLFDCHRHDPVLVEAVETLGKLAQSDVADLKVHTLKCGNRYMIEQYDGMENVVEPEDIKWTHACV